VWIRVDKIRKPDQLQQIECLYTFGSADRARTAQRNLRRQYNVLKRGPPRSSNASGTSADLHRCATPDGCPAMVSDPLAMGASPAIARSRLDLPHPLGPSRDTNSPLATENKIGPAASISPNLIRTSSTTTRAPLLLARLVTAVYHIMHRHVDAIHFGRSSLVKALLPRHRSSESGFEQHLCSLPSRPTGDPIGPIRL